MCLGIAGVEGDEGGGRNLLGFCGSLILRLVLVGRFVWVIVGKMRSASLFSEGDVGLSVR